MDDRSSADKRAVLRQQILKHSWFHSIDLGDGLVTPGRIPLEELQRLAERVRLPQNMRGQRVLDIGAWDGFFSFEVERRGAQHVLAVDVVPVEYTGFELARRYLGSRAEYRQLSVYELSSEQLGQFDSVMFFGVWYHLRYPLLALDRIWEVLKPGGALYLESACLDNYLVLDDEMVASLEAIDPALRNTALLQFYRFDELTPGDFSNWFSFSRKAVEDMLASAGFEVRSVEMWGHRIGVYAVKLPGLPEYQRIRSYESLGANTHPPFTKAELDEFERRRRARRRRPYSGPSGQHNAMRASPPEPLSPLRDAPDWERVRALLRTLQGSRMYRLMRRLGRWAWLEKGIREILGDSDE